MPQPAALFDGGSARAHSVTAEGLEGRLRLSMESGWDDEIPATLITKLSEDSKRLRLGRADMEGWSLILDKPLDDDVASLVPKGDGYGRWIDRIGLWPAVAAGAVLTASIVAMGYLAPHWIAPHIPMSWERRLGSAIVGDFGSNRCSGAEGQRALEALAERLEPGSTHGPNAIRIVALDVPMFNAVALPGGYIVVFQGAIDEVDDPDALAGIVAHEIAHVRRRHVAEALVRELGISAVIRMFAGDVGSNAEQLLSLNYTRKNESEADSDAIATLNRVHISPRPTSELFQKLAKEEREEPGFTGDFLQSHPLSGSRAKRFAAAEDKGVHYKRALTDDEFDALKLMCRNAKGK